MLYEIGSPRYFNPDVTARFDTITLAQIGDDRVRVSGVRGEAPPADLKIGLNYAGGYRNSMVLVLEGQDVAAKANLAEQTIWARIDGGKASFDAVDVDLVGADPALLRISVLDQDKAKVGRAFSAAVVETALASYPGFYALSPPGDASAYGVYWPTSVPAALVSTQVFIDGQPVWSGPARVEPSGDAREHPKHREPTANPQQPTAPPQPSEPSEPTAPTAPPQPSEPSEPTAPIAPPQPSEPKQHSEPHANASTERQPLGKIVGARSGDKGGNANLGVWTRTDAEFAWLDAYLTETQLRLLLPALANLPVERYRLPNLRALNFVIVGLLGRGVAASTRLDPQAKALGEELRAALADIPTQLLTNTPPRLTRGPVPPGAPELPG